MTRVVVTGGAGFIGSHLVDALVERGDDVTVIDNLKRGRLENLAIHLESGTIRFHHLDIREYGDLLASFQSAEVVYHLAAQSNVMGAIEDPDYSVTTNVLGTHNVLRAASSAGARRVVFSSSREVYGDPSELPVFETAPLSPKNPYGASKVAGEAYCQVWQKTHGLEVQVLRLGNIYGPRDFDRVIPLWLERAQQGEELVLFGGQQIIDFLWVEYAVEALLAAAECTPSGPINVATGQPTELKSLAEKILTLTASTSRTVIAESRAAEVRGFIADTGKMTAVLGVVPPQDPLSDLGRTLA